MKDKVFSSNDWHTLNNEPIFVGIDQSYSGFAITLLRGDQYYTVVKKFEGIGVDRLHEVYTWVKESIPSVDDVAMEGYAYGSMMANMAGELGATVKLALRELNIYPLIVPPTMVKKYVSGKGQGVQKNQILLAVYKKWGVEFTDDNAADSYILARIAQGTGTLSYEKEVLNKLSDPKYREKQ